jgi:hypothetical protein
VPAATPEEVHALFDQCAARARQELIRELGDPTPHKLA